MNHISLILCILLSGVVLGQYHYERVYLPGAGSLTFTKNKVTSYRLSSPVPKLTCIPAENIHDFYFSLYVCEKYGPSVVQCKNTGLDDDDQPIWKCEGDMIDLFSFGQTTISCEGFEGPNDPYILADSCSLEYKLILSDKGHRHFSKKPALPRLGYQPNYYNNQRTDFAPHIYDKFLSFAGLVFSIPVLMFFIVCCIFYIFPLQS